VEPLTDAFQDRFDKALLVSADCVLSGPVKKIKHLFTDKKLFWLFLRIENRKSWHLWQDISL